MGSLRSFSDCSGLVINKLTLGMPTVTDETQLNAEPVLFVWDDPRLPNGVIEDDGTITPDMPEDI